jgi:hypothetical protein
MSTATERAQLSAHHATFGTTVCYTVPCLHCLPLLPSRPQYIRLVKASAANSEGQDTDSLHMYVYLNYFLGN